MYTVQLQNVYHMSCQCLQTFTGVHALQPGTVFNCTEVLAQSRRQCAGALSLYSYIYLTVMLCLTLPELRWTQLPLFSRSVFIDNSRQPEQSLFVPSNNMLRWPKKGCVGDAFKPLPFKISTILKYCKGIRPNVSLTSGTNQGCKLIN